MTPRQPVGNKQVVTDNVRGSILNASLDLMNQGGLSVLSMREVARRAGVSHQAPYHYFADRESILAEVGKERSGDESGFQGPEGGEELLRALRQESEQDIPGPEARLPGA